VGRSRPSAQVDLLTQAIELVVRKEPALLDEFYTSFLELRVR
jgi:hypothetical protein